MPAAIAALAAFLSLQPPTLSRAKYNWPPASLVPVQSKNPGDLAVGKMLVASRALHDPNFAQTVILLVRYNDQGVIGLILNRPTTIPISQVLDLDSAKNCTDPAWLGGPMEPSVAFALYQTPGKLDKAESIFSGVYMITDRKLFEKTIATHPDPHVFHVYLGYAGWTQDQLQAEVKLGAWYIFPADPDSVFTSDPNSLWQTMIDNTNLLQARNTPPRLPGE